MRNLKSLSCWNRIGALMSLRGCASDCQSGYICLILFVCCCTSWFAAMLQFPSVQAFALLECTAEDAQMRRLGVVVISQVMVAHCSRKTNLAIRSRCNDRKRTVAENCAFFYPQLICRNCSQSPGLCMRMCTCKGVTRYVMHMHMIDIDFMSAWCSVYGYRVF
jgi:hypothetical protein